MVLHSIELCAGVGMLGEGVRAAFEFLGLEHRTVCYVEREAAAASQLVALMEAGALDSAPIWSDLLTFNGAAWRGCVDLVIAGFPCQDLSIAGRRAGLNGKRSGLFFNVLDVADACDAWGIVLENVSGIASAGATVVDEEEGELEERAAARVVGELADRGWRAEWVPLSASDVGANHGRLRWFCFAWRVADPGCGDASGVEYQSGAGRGEAEHCAGIALMVDAGRVHWRTGHEQDRSGGAAPARIETHHRASDGGGLLGHAGGLDDEARGSQCAHSGEPEGRQRPDDAIIALDDAQCLEFARQRVHEGSWAEKRGASDADGASRALADTPSDGRPERGPKSGRKQGRPDVAECGRLGVGQADPDSAGLQGRRECGDSGRREEPHGHAGLASRSFFAPGPLDPIWTGLINASRLGSWERAVTDDEAGACPWAPATKPGVRMLVDGMAIVVDESRSHQLRQIGNGVVSLCAAVAVVELVRRARGS